MASRDTDSAGGRSRATWGALAVVALLLAIFGLRLSDAAARWSLTADEPHYVGTGLYLSASGDYDPTRTLIFHPPLAYHLAALPLRLVDRGGVEITPGVGRDLMASEVPGPDRVRWLSRLPFVLLSAWGALLVFLWAREAAGLGAGLLAIALYTLSPLVLAHSALAHTDITVTVFFLQTLYAFWRWTQRPTPARLAVCGLSLGLAMISKLTALLLLPLLGVLLLFHAWRLPPLAADGWGPPDPSPAGWLRAGLRATGRLAVLVALTLAVVWIGYGGSFAFAPVETGSLAGVRLPAILHGLFYDLDVNRAGRNVYYLGEIADDGRFWSLLPVAWAVKTPIPELLLVVLALATRPAPGPASRRGIALFPALPILLFLGLAVFWVRVPMGVRYMLPAVPLLHVLVATRLAPPTGWRRPFVAACLLWLAGVGLWIHPHYLAYFNALVGGPSRGHEVLVESNLDWGQDLGTLARALRERGNPRVALAYFGPEPPERFGIRARPLRGCAPTTGWVAISATLRAGLYRARNPFARAPEGCFDWLDAHEPVARPGYSIFLYHVPGPGAPRESAPPR